MFIGKRQTRMLLVMAVVLSLAVFNPPPSSAAQLDGRWTLTVTIPDGPRSRNTRTFVLTADVSPRGASLNGRLTLTDGENTFPGVWRQAGKRVSMAFELCPGPFGSPCASLIMVGKMKPETRLKKGRIIVMWDTPNDDDPSFHDSGSANFGGTRLQ
jgi:hypothetical protein